jgi:hypothetical protein
LRDSHGARWDSAQSTGHADALVVLRRVDDGLDARNEGAPGARGDSILGRWLNVFLVIEIIVSIIALIALQGLAYFPMGFSVLAAILVFGVIGPIETLYVLNA